MGEAGEGARVGTAEATCVKDEGCRAPCWDLALRLKGADVGLDGVEGFFVGLRGVCKGALVATVMGKPT